MNPNEYQDATSGRLIRTKSGYWAFVPAPLSPQINWSERLIGLLSTADRELAQLAQIGETFPNPYIMVRSFVRREAVLSSRIEGTRTTLQELYAYEAYQFSFLEPGTDAQEVQNYVHALEYGLERLATLPVSLRLMRELHQQLMEGVRGEFWTPGEFRRSQNWIGAPGATIETATYVPPPVDEMHTCLDQLEKFIHAPTDLPLLIRLGLIHYQFEAVHPFLDGNGRVGRLLVSLLLCAWGLLPQPLLYLSAYFEAQRSEYYRYLLAVSQKGAWESWLSYFLTGVAEQAHEARMRIATLDRLRSAYQDQLQGERTHQRLMQAIDFLFGQPILSIRQLQAGLEAGSYLTAQRVIEKLEQFDILREITGKARNRIYQADEILRAIDGPV